jgi:hypothetical protein
LLFLNASGGEIASFVNRGSNGTNFRLGWSRYIDEAFGDRVLEKLKEVTCDG